jgi:GntR family transcriptional regulator / MocR family aminotransferase
LSGQLAAGTALPSTRLLAKTFDVSRLTVVSAFDQLVAEGYVEGKPGAGTYVAHVQPDQHLFAPPLTPSETTDGKAPRRLSRRSAFVDWLPGRSSVLPAKARAFRPGLPALDAFPFSVWQRLSSACARALPANQFDYGDPAGYAPLREAVAGYLSMARGVRCTASQILIVGGTQQATELAARLLLDEEDPVWVERPGYRAAQGVLAASGARLVYVSVDGEGLDVQAGIAACSTARLAYVTPSHQFPLGMTMSLSRRLALLDWANQANMWVIEDDYDSEFRHVGRPLPSLQGLDSANRVLYVGTFSKVLFPALRLGYMVLPPDLVEPFYKARSLLSGPPPILEQASTARFMSDGHFERHIRRMRTLYAERQAMLQNMVAADPVLSEHLDIAPSAAGMHLVGWLADNINDAELARQVAKQGIITPPLSAFGMSTGQRPALLLGYSGCDAATMRQGLAALSRELRHFTNNSRG